MSVLDDLLERPIQTIFDGLIFVATGIWSSLDGLGMPIKIALATMFPLVGVVWFTVWVAQIMFPRVSTFMAFVIDFLQDGRFDSVFPAMEGGVAFTMAGTFKVVNFVNTFVPLNQIFYQCSLLVLWWMSLRIYRFLKSLIPAWGA